MERIEGPDYCISENIILNRSSILGKLLIKDAHKIAQDTKVSSISQLPSQDVTRVAVNFTVPPVPRRRHATESAMLPGKAGQRIPDKYTVQDERTGVSPTPESRGRIGPDRRQINITNVVDKFLLEFMQALSDDREDPGHIPLIHDVHNKDHTTVPAKENETKTTSLQWQYGATLGSECITKSEDLSSQPSDVEESSITPNKKLKPSYRPSRPPLLPPCRVCSDKASGYHYGVNTCEACKGFFRRSICKTGSYVCTGSGNCSTFGGKRTLCSYCRFKRCLEAGMSKDAIKTGRYTHELRSKNILEVKSLERLYGELEGSETLTEQTSRESDMLYAAFQTDYRKNKVLDETLQALVDGQKYLYEFLDDYYNEELMKERQLAVYIGYINKTKASENVSPQIRHTHIDITQTGGQSNSTETSNTVHSGYPTDKCVNHVNMRSDNYSHSSTNVPPVTNKEVSTPADERVKAEVMAKIITNMEQSVQGMLIFAKALPRFDSLPKDDQASLLKAGRFDVWYIGHIRCFNVDLRVGACEWQFHANELAQVWGDDMINLAFSLSRVGQSLKMTKEETAALRAVCLTFPDRCMDLVERDEVEKIHQDMLDVLKHVACKRMSSNAYHKWFCKVIDFLMLLREFGVKFEAISSNIKLDWSVLKNNPLLLSVFLS